MVQDHARLDRGGACVQVQTEQVFEIFAVVDDQRCAGGLAALAGAAAAWQYRHTGLARQFNRGCDVAGGARHEHPGGHDLVDRRIGGVAAAGGGVKQDFALRVVLQLLGKQRTGLMAGCGGAERRAGGCKAHMG